MGSALIKVAVILGSTRPGRNGEAVAKWLDIQSFRLPILDEPVPPSRGQYSKPHTKAWAAKADAFDAYVFVTPEYNHGTSGAPRTPSIIFTANGTTRPPDS